MDNALLIAIAAVIFTISTLLIIYYSYRGGAWLWQEIGSSIEFSQQALKRGAVVLWFGLLVLLIFLFLLVNDDSQAHAKIVSHFTLALAFTVAYNCGFLFSILPARRTAAKYKNLNITGLLATLWGFATPALVVFTFNNVSPWLLLAALFAGFILYGTGFFLWEQFRQSHAFQKDTFANLLWLLSVGFVAISVLIMLAGIATHIAGPEKISPLLPIVLIMLIIVSLLAYMTGLIKALPKQN